MAKYRLLGNDELKEMEKEFIDFLVINGITADDWEKIMLQDDKEEASKIIELFSDVVFEQIFRKAEYLLLIESERIMSIHCDKEQMHLIAVSSRSDEYDLNNWNHIDFSDEKVLKHVDLFTGRKIYPELREQHLFKLSNEGYRLDKGQIHNYLLKWIE